MRSKFFATKFKDDYGNVWDSKKEYERYLELEEDETIKNLQRQVRFEVLPKYVPLRKGIDRPERAIYYTCDFAYIMGNTLFIEDVKSIFTRKDRDYIMRRKLLKHRYFNDNSYQLLHDLFPDLQFKYATFVEFL